MRDNFFVVLDSIDRENPTSVDAYIKAGGFAGLRAAVRLPKDEIGDEVLIARLLGRGGAAYPIGRKWQKTFEAAGEKYIVCNADEGDPGTYKDRDLLQYAPLRVLEGMLIAAYSLSAKHCYIYIRGEYARIQTLFAEAIENARTGGYLGTSILGMPGFDCDVTIVSGAGAYVCGEVTALLNSIEGKAGLTRLSPPYPTEAGLYSKPTFLSNVETFACVPKIFEIGAENYAEYGSDYSGGAKLVCLSGHAKNRRIFEVRGRTPLREVLEAPWFGGGSGTGRPIKFFQLGGMAGAIGFPEQADVPYCYKHLADKGLTVGSGAIIVMDESVCLVDYLLRVAAFFRAESCGKCTPCRLGQKEVVRLLEKLTTGRGAPGDVEKLEKLAKQIAATAACGLGRGAVTGLLCALGRRRKELEAHETGSCPAEACKMEVRA